MQQPADLKVAAARTCRALERGDAGFISALIEQLAQGAAHICRQLLAVSADAHRLALVHGVVQVVGGQEGQVEPALPVHPEGAPNCCCILPKARVLHQGRIIHIQGTRLYSHPAQGLTGKGNPTSHSTGEGLLALSAKAIGSTLQEDIEANHSATPLLTDKMQ